MGQFLDIEPFAADFGTDLNELKAVLSKRYDPRNRPTGRLILEIDPALLQEHVVRLLDTGVGAGFGNIQPVSLQDPLPAAPESARIDLE